MQDNTWKPSPKQAEFLALPYEIKEAMYGGGVGCAKTETLLMYPLVHRFYENPRFKQLYTRRTYPELEKEVIQRAKRLYAPFGAKYNGQSKAHTFPSGAMIFYGHLENEDDVHKYDSMEINLFTPDEIQSYFESQYLYIAFERVRSSLGSGLPSIIRAAGMPGNIGHTWVKRRFVDPNPKGGSVIIGRGGNKRIYIHATLKDNPHGDPNYAQSLEALPQAERDAKLYGKWDAYLGQVFEEFRDRRYPDEPDNALHVIDKFAIPDWWPRIIAIDWGFAPPAMTWVGYGAISPDQRLYIYREQAWQKTKIEEWCQDVKYYLTQENIKSIILCKSAGQDRGQDHTIYSQIMTALNFPVELTTGNAGSRIAGKALIHEYLRFKPKPIKQLPSKDFDEQYAAWLLRNKSASEYQTYMRSFDPPEKEGNLPRLQIFADCPLLIQAIKIASYDTKGNTEDVAEFPGDDPYDGLRYLVDRAERYFQESSEEFNKLKKQDELVQRLHQTNDWTAYYRNIRALENSSDDFIKPIRRYAHH